MVLDTENPMMGQKYTFFFAAKEGRLSDLVWVLNQKNASPNIRDGESQSTALHMTCARGHAKCAEVLIKAGAHVNCRTAEGMTPLHFATYGGHISCVHVLLKANADVHATTRFGCTALHQAAFFNRQKCAEMIIQNGGGINSQESWGLTPLAVAAQKGDRYVVSSGHGLVKSQMMKMLLANKADTSIQDKLDGKTPLHISIENGHIDCAMALLDGGANPNILDVKGMTALHYACRCQGAEVLIPTLLEFGASLIVVDKDRETACDKLTKSRDKHLSEDCKDRLLTRLKDSTGKPRSLMTQCRITIRKTLGPSELEQIDDFPVPKALVNYLHMKDI